MSKRAQKELPKKSGKRGLSPIYLDEKDFPEQSNVLYLRSNKRKKIVFGWYGGKFSHLDWLLPLLPKCHHYCEPFAGSAAGRRLPVMSQLIFSTERKTWKTTITT